MIRPSRYLPVAFIALGGLLFCIRAGCVGSNKPDSIPTIIQKFVDRKEVSGAVTLVASKDKVIALDAVGLADVAGRIPMKTDTIFWIASMTKPITGTAIMMLQEEGKLSLDDPVSKYIPELAHLKTADGVEHVVTLRHLLTHTSGLPDLTPLQFKAARTLAGLIPLFTEKPLNFVPGSKWQYGQAGLNTLGRIVEVISGQSFPDFLRTRLFDPLGMNDTGFYPSKKQLARIAKLYNRNGAVLEEAPNFIMQGLGPGSHDRLPGANGGLFSTAPDYARFLQMILNQGELNGKRYLKPESVKQMTTVQSGDLTTGFTPGNGWGLAWCIIREPQGVTASLSPGTHGHGGAFGTQGWIDPQKGVVLVLLVQRANFPNGDASDVRKEFQETALRSRPR